MKTIISFFLFTLLAFGQVKIDSSNIYYAENVFTFNGYATFQQPVSVGDYTIGYKFSQNKEEYSYVPMGSYNLSVGNRKIHW